MFGKDFWAGSLWGVSILRVNVALMMPLRAYSIGTIALPAIEILKYATLGAVTYLGVGIAEEFAFRGYLQYTLTQATEFWPAAV
jgi:membrane protease YdiL (CAAX protease family)